MGCLFECTGWWWCAPCVRGPGVLVRVGRPGGSPGGGVKTRVLQKSPCLVPPSVYKCRPKAVATDDSAFAASNPVRMETLTEIAMATEMETTTVAVPAVLAVRVEVRVPAARTAAPSTI